jgi:nitrogen fixation protein FixH
MNTLPTDHAMPLARGKRQPLFWVPWAFVGAFLLVIAVNAVLITFATRTFSGLVVEKPYLKGLAYEETLRQEKAQAALGWTATTAFRNGEEIAVRYLDKSGQPLTSLAVEAQIESPLRPEPALSLPLAYDGDGWYRGRVAFQSPGQREVQVTAARGELRHQLRFRIVAP